MRTAACVILPYEDRFIAISRRNDTSRWGLPGGKVDAHEDNVQGIFREAGEELSYRLHKDLLVPIYSGACLGQGPEDTFWTTTYLYCAVVDPVYCRPEKGFEIRLMDRSALCNPGISPYARYNVLSFEAMDLFQGGGRIGGWA